MRHIFDICSLRLRHSCTARVYADSLKDNFVGYTPTKQTVFDQLKSDFHKETEKKDPSLSELLRIESALVEVLPDNIITSKIWAMRDRFERVVPKATRDRYYASIQDIDKKRWDSDVEFVRGQTRSLLDTIHANYVLNEGRENLIMRLKRVIFLIFCVVTLSFCLAVRYKCPLVAYGAIILFGMLGAIMSIIRRLQTAVQDDAMADDGIHELMNLEKGHFGILSSVFSGGIFALLFYFLVISGLLQSVMPKPLDDFIPQLSADSTNCTPFSSSTASSEQKLLTTAPNLKAEEPKQCSASSFEVVKSFVVTLGLKCISDLFKLLVFAFISGFAERFVPDVLDRIVKKTTETKG